MARPGPSNILDAETHSRRCKCRTKKGPSHQSHQVAPSEKCRQPALSAQEPLVTKGNEESWDFRRSEAEGARRLSQQPALSEAEGACPERSRRVSPAHSTLVNELVVHNRRRQRAILLFGGLFGLWRICTAHHASLAHDIAVLLPGNLFRHLEHHLDQRI